MELTIPIRILSSRLRSRARVNAQLYNLDDDQFFNFQFMPRDGASTDINWTDNNWRGSDRTHRQYLGTGQAQIDIAAEFCVDPGCPPVNSNTEPSINYDDGAGNTLISIENIIEVLKSWAQEIRSEEGRPALIRIIRPEGSFDGVITRLGYNPDEMFNDGTLRRATIRIGFKQWRRIA